MNFPNSKIVLIIVFIICLFSILLITLREERIDLSLKGHNNLKALQINEFDKLLSEKERSALIRQIVKDSLKELSILMKPMTSALLPVTENRKIDPIVFQRMFHDVEIVDQNHSIRNLKMNPFQIQVTVEERNIMYMLLEVFDKTMKAHNFTYIMYGGTLLGSFRHHDLIPWDDDLDVIVAIKFKNDMESIFKPLSPEFTFMKAGGHDKFYHVSGKQSSDYSWKWPYLDISYYEENDTYIKDSVQTYHRWYSFPKAIVFPLHNRPLLNLSLPAPKDTFAFLAWTYNYGSACVMYGYSHMVEGAGPVGNLDCKQLSNKFPFVEHFPHENGVREILKYKGIEITDIVLPEPKYAVAETFEISLKPMYKMPSEITAPPK